MYSPVALQPRPLQSPGRHCAVAALVCGVLFVTGCQKNVATAPKPESSQQTPEGGAYAAGNPGWLDNLVGQKGAATEDEVQIKRREAEPAVSTRESAPSARENFLRAAGVPHKGTAGKGEAAQGDSTGAPRRC
ncbi:MAG: hypothetical protein ABSE73_27910 [Planctomycetota bacterium]